MAFEAYLTITPSDTTDPSYKITVESFSFGAAAATNAGSGSTGAGAGKVTFKDLTITKTLDKASPLLYSAVSSGAHITSAVLELLPAVQAGGRSEATFTFKDVYITEITDMGNVDGGPYPFEQIKLEYTALSFEVDDVTFGDPGD